MANSSLQDTRRMSSAPRLHVHKMNVKMLPLCFLAFQLVGTEKKKKNFESTLYGEEHH
jgi:hypothetical protein